MLKHFISFAIIIVITFVLLEVMSALMFKSLTGEEFNTSKLQNKYLSILDVIEKKIGQKKEISTVSMLHPYLGYVNSPTSGINSYGMTSHYPLLTPYKKSKNKFVIAIIGGSVASHFSRDAAERNLLLKALHRLKPNITNKEVILIPFAVGGFKQPQQLFALQHALLMGFEFDLVINLDGYNDLIMAVSNFDKDINPSFPSGYHTAMLGQLAKGIDYNLAKSLSNVYSIYKSSQDFLGLMGTSPFKQSRAMNLFTYFKIAYTKRTLGKLQYDAVQNAQRNTPLEFKGPPFDKSQDKYKMAVRIWKEASIQVDAICQLYDIKYLHVLQPNQYVKDSKVLSNHEKEVAFHELTPWSLIAVNAYHLLIKEGKSLNKTLLFKDMTMIFKDIKKDIYYDDCCHFNVEGNDILAQEIAQVIISENLLPKRFEH